MMANSISPEKLANPIPFKSYFISRFLFLRVLGLIYFIAFLSLNFQIIGLFGEYGVMPIRTTQSILEDYALQKNWGADLYFRYPSLFWLQSSDAFLQGFCILGQIVALFVFFGVAVVPSLVLLWIFYLSVTTLGSAGYSPFLGYQWDGLLLEVGLLSIFLAPLQLWPKKLSQESPVCLYTLFLFWWLLFRLMFGSGLFKILSGDPTWRNGTALHYHYFTQPLTTWVAWYLYWLPDIFHSFSVFLMFLIQIVAALFIFVPSLGRLGAAISLIFLQLMIILTGNYAFFNYLSIAICLLLIEDSYWQKLFSWVPYFRGKPIFLPSQVSSNEASEQQKTIRPPQIVAVTIILFVIFLTFLRIFSPALVRKSPEALLYKVLERTQDFYIVNYYGLFTRMTTTRPEILLEGSLDGSEWKPYHFFWKAGEVTQIPRFVAPHQPRLDWQMWFAALDRIERNIWLLKLMQRILENREPVLALLQKSPFEKTPPKYVRAVLYDYTFSTWEEKKVSGSWWSRQKIRPYTKIWTLEELQQALTQLHPALRE